MAAATPIKLLARLLWSVQNEIAVRVATIEGGDQYNAIPREAAAVVAVPETEVTRLTEYVDGVRRNGQAGIGQD